MTDQMQAGEGHWYLSFCDAERLRGQQFLGAAIVPASNMIEAVQTAHTLGINPGGEVQGLEVPRPVPKKWVGRLLSRSDIDEMDAELIAGERP